MNVVLDTNIFVSGIHWETTSRKILRAWLSDKFILISSWPIIDEICSTLKDFRIHLEEKEFSVWESLLLENSLIVEPHENLGIVKDDPEDNKFIEAAVAGNAQYIISQDKHLLKLKEFRGIRIIRPDEFFKLLSK